MRTIDEAIREYLGKLENELDPKTQDRYKENIGWLRELKKYREDTKEFWAARDMETGDVRLFYHKPENCRPESEKNDYPDWMDMTAGYRNDYHVIDGYIFPAQLLTSLINNPKPIKMMFPSMFFGREDFDILDWTELERVTIGSETTAVFAAVMYPFRKAVTISGLSPSVKITWFYEKSKHNLVGYSEDELDKMIEDYNKDLKGGND
jgi:hypothetical protein